MTRPGFTLLETTLAMVIGSLILAATLGVLFTVENADRALGDQAREMNDLAATQHAVRTAMASLHVAPLGTIRAALEDDLSEIQIEAYLDEQYPEPVAGVPWRFEMSPGDRPQLEVVLVEPLLDRPAPAPSSGPRRGGPFTVHAEQLIGHRGAFELRDPEPNRRGETPPGLELWWVPLPPPQVPTTVRFDDASLPPPARLCRGVTLVRWTGFIDSQRVPAIRAVVPAQLPAFLELEIRTAGGAYGNWTFELGFDAGPEIVAPAEATEGLPAQPTVPTIPPVLPRGSEVQG